MSNLNYMADPNEVEALVSAVKAFFRDAADKQCVDVAWAVELLTSVVQLVDPDYTPPEPDEEADEGADLPDITATCSCCGGIISVCDSLDDEYVWYHYSPSLCDDPDAIPGTVLVNGAPNDELTPAVETTP
jgi:hypothetical protein